MEQKLNMGLSYALGPFPDEPVLKAIDRVLFYSDGLGRITNYSKQNNVILYNAPLGTDCSVERLKKVENSNTLTSPQTKPENDSEKEFENDSEKESEKDSNGSFEILVPKIEECEDFKGNNDRLRIKTPNNSLDLKSYEIWTEEVCQDCPSLVFILSPSGEAITFEYVSSQ